MYNVIFIKHSDISKQDLDSIIDVKQTAWKYSYENQIEWIKENINKDDIHCLLYLDKKLVAYANLVLKKMIINNKEHSFLGLGNVCAYDKGKGLGSKLLEYINVFIIKNGFIGLLFCKPQVSHFYLKNGWRKIPNQFVKINFCDTLVCTMIFNFNYEIFKLEYKGKLF